MGWVCYLLWSEKLGKTYVGCTNNFSRRLRQHNGELSGGGIFTSRGRPWELVALTGNKVKMKDRSSAQKMERFIKKGRGLKGRLERLKMIHKD